MVDLNAHFVTKVTRLDYAFKTLSGPALLSVITGNKGNNELKSFELWS